MRTYRYRVKKLKIRRRLIALGLIVSLGAGGFVLAHSIGENKKPVEVKEGQELLFVSKDSLNSGNDEYLGEDFDVEISVPTPTSAPTITPTPVVVPVMETNIPALVNSKYSKGDSIIATTNVNLRLNADKKSFKMGELPKGAVADRILTVGNWDLVKYNGQISFVCNDYTRTNDVDYNNDYYYMEEYSDIVRTTTQLYFRLGPSKSEADIELLPKNEELVVLSRAIPYNNPDDAWYLVKHKGKIGFVNAGYTTSLKEKLRETLPDVEDLKILKMAYVKTPTDLINSNGVVYKRISEYQLVKVLIEYDDFSLVEYGTSIGLVRKNDIKEYNGTFVVVDLSDQKVYLYCYADMVFEDVCTTGKDGMNTRTGAFKVSERTNSRYFSDEAQARYIWARFDGGNGLHDAPWENKKNFGSQNFRKKRGSKGCVRLPDEAALLLKEYVEVGTEVLVKD